MTWFRVQTLADKAARQTSSARSLTSVAMCCKGLVFLMQHVEVARQGNTETQTD